MGTLYCILYFIWVFICLLTHFLCRHSFERVLRLESLVLWLEILYTPTDPYILNGLTDFLTNFKRDILCKASNKSVPIVYKTLLKNTNWIKVFKVTKEHWYSFLFLQAKSVLNFATICPLPPLLIENMTTFKLRSL